LDASTKIKTTSNFPGLPIAVGRVSSVPNRNDQLRPPIVAFSLGLIAVLISIGLVTVYVRRLLALVPAEGPVINHWLQMASAAVIMCLGVAIVLRAVALSGPFTNHPTGQLAEYCPERIAGNLIVGTLPRVAPRCAPG
jgi:hypothetical protein